jgi:hypothetical protein
MAVLEPDAGFGSWRALFGFGGKARRRSPTNSEDLMAASVITNASERNPSQVTLRTADDACSHRPIPK